jgi:hypothetical protein
VPTGDTVLTESRTGTGQDAFSARAGQVMRAPRPIVVRALQRALRSVAGTRRDWARQLVLAEATVLEWRQGHTIPSLWCLLLVSDRLGISPLELVCDQVGDDERTMGGYAAPEAGLDRPHRVRTTIVPEAVRRALEAILASDESYARRRDCQPHHQRE